MLWLVLGGNREMLMSRVEQKLTLLGTLALRGRRCQEGQGAQNLPS